jgi:hypothetical protein
VAVAGGRSEVVEPFDLLGAQLELTSAAASHACGSGWADGGAIFERGTGRLGALSMAIW